MRVEGEHLLQVLKHVIKESSTEAPLLKLPPVSVHSLLMRLKVAVKVSLLVALILGVGVKVVMVLPLLAKVVIEDVIKVEVKGLVVLFEVIFASSSLALP